MEWTEFIGYGTTAVAAVGGWVMGRRKQNNDFIADLQGSINLLSDNYTRTLNELVTVRGQNAKLISGQADMQLKIEALTLENGKLKREIEELNEKLTNVRTITRKV